MKRASGYGNGEIVSSKPHQPHAILASSRNVVRVEGQAELEQAGYNVLTCVDYPSALAALSERMPDIFIVDYDMTNNRGVPMALQVARTSTFERLPILILHFEQWRPDWMWKPDPDLWSHVFSVLILLSGKKPYINGLLAEHVQRALIVLKRNANT